MQPTSSAFDLKLSVYLQSALPKIERLASKIETQTQRGDSERRTKEANTKSYLVNPFLRDVLGFDTEDDQCVVFEYPHQYGSNPIKYVDYAIFVDSALRMIIESKSNDHDFCEKAAARPHTSSVTDDLSQLVEYSALRHAHPTLDVVVWTNGLEYRFYCYVNGTSALNLRPCFIFRLDSHTSEDLQFLRLFQRQALDLAKILEYARNQQLISDAQHAFDELWDDLEDVLTTELIRRLRLQARSANATRLSKDECGAVRSVVQQRLQQRFEVIERRSPEPAVSLPQTFTKVSTSPEKTSPERVEITLDELTAHACSADWTTNGAYSACVSVTLGQIGQITREDKPGKPLRWGLDVVFRSAELLVAKFPELLGKMRQIAKMTKAERNLQQKTTGDRLFSCYQSISYSGRTTVEALSASAGIVIPVGISSQSAILQLDALCKLAGLPVESVMLRFAPQCQ